MLDQIKHPRLERKDDQQGRNRLEHALQGPARLSRGVSSWLLPSRFSVCASYSFVWEKNVTTYRLCDYSLGRPDYWEQYSVKTVVGALAVNRRDW